MRFLGRFTPGFSLPIAERHTERAMFDQRPAFYAACCITGACLVLAACLAVFGPDPATQSINRLLDALIYISIAGALAIFGLLGFKPDKKPPEPS